MGAARWPGRRGGDRRMRNHRGPDSGAGKTGGKEIAFLSVILSAGLAVRLAVSWQDFSVLFRKCVVDDALFYMNIARNIAEGHGATFDGSILTNGFHAIYAILLVPVFLLLPDDPDLTIHIALTIISVLNVLTGIVIFRIVKEISGSGGAFVAAFLWTFNPYVIAISLNGVEAGVACFLLSLCIRQYAVMRMRNRVNTRNLVLLGIYAGLAVLGRIDAVFLLATIGLFLLVSSYRREKNLIRSLPEAAIYGISAFAIMAPWFLWNLYHFGTIRQVSGATLPNIAHSMFLARHKTYLSAAFLRQEAFYLFMWMKNIVRYSGGFPLFAVAGGWFAWNAWRNRGEGLRQLGNRLMEADFAILSSAAMVAFYALYFWGWHRPWYYLSVMTVVTVCLGIFSGYMLGDDPETGRTARRTAGTTGILYAALFLYFSVGGMGIWEKGLFPFQKQLYDSAIWMRENTGKDKRIGSISSGAYGYFTNRTTDLLGVVNQDAYRAIREKRMFAYITEKKIDYLVDREDMVRLFSEQFDRNGFMDRLEPVKRFGDRESDVVVYKVK